MGTVQYAAEMVKELQQAVHLIHEDDAEKLTDAILRAKKIVVAGAGRSGLMVRAFAMRLMHMGLSAYVVGETITPAIAKGDLLVIGSGSGETKSLVPMADKAKSLDAALALVTIFPESTIGKKSDIVVTLPGSPKDQTQTTFKTIQPMGSLFEQTLLLFFDAVVLRLMEKQGMDAASMFGRHANLELSTELT